MPSSSKRRHAKRTKKRPVPLEWFEVMAKVRIASLQRLIQQYLVGYWDACKYHWTEAFTLVEHPESLQSLWDGIRLLQGEWHSSVGYAFRQRFFTKLTTSGVPLLHDDADENGSCTTRQCKLAMLHWWRFIDEHRYLSERLKLMVKGRRETTRHSFPLTPCPLELEIVLFSVLGASERRGPTMSIFWITTNRLVVQRWILNEADENDDETQASRHKDVDRDTSQKKTVEWWS